MERESSGIEYIETNESLSSLSFSVSLCDFPISQLILNQGFSPYTLRSSGILFMITRVLEHGTTKYAMQ
ncbi:hypothetical protein LWI29_001843 [Acer saccharum]|uniref:Uncharacterized protein n=1 Tax=Acer saccharum TaxID=4024 RepID=A0AA39SZI4_ACESA|nr:hypothetical protein LWI29_001843 [Acer saccharum]KAK1583481.1 hypothetical protein Q3G72_024136 [Acer saccharum]